MNALKRWTWWVLPIAVFLLTGCASSSSDSSSGSGSALIIITASGADEDVTGTWAKCTDNGATDGKNIWIFDGSSVTVEEYTYTSTDISCSAGEVLDGSALITVAADSNVSTEWSDDAIVGATPPTGLGGTALDSPATATKVRMTLEDDTFGPAGTEFFTVMLVDDTDGPNARDMYRATSDPTADCSDGAGGETCLFNADQLVKQ